MKKLKIIIKVIYNILFVFLIISALFILLTTYDIIPGFNFYVVMSGSMEPTIKTGSVVVISEQNQYNIDDIITVRERNNPNQTFTHRIIDITDTQEDIEYITKGDANETADPDTVLEEQIVGKKTLSIPIIGYLVHFAKQPTGFILMIIVPSIIIATSEVTTIKEEGSKLMKSYKEKKEEKKKELEKEKEKKEEPKKKEEKPKKEPKKKQPTKKKSKSSKKKKNVNSKKKKK
jgi:signal peptidase I